MLKTVLAVVAVVAATLFASFNAVAAGGSPSSTRIRLEARLSAPGTAMKGHARYQEERGVRRFDAQIERATPGTRYTVTHQGKAIATITANSFGRAEISVRTATDDPGRQGSVPAMATGDVIQIGVIKGQLAPR